MSYTEKVRRALLRAMPWGPCSTELELRSTEFELPVPHAASIAPTIPTATSAPVRVAHLIYPGYAPAAECEVSQGQ